MFLICKRHMVNVDIDNNLYEKIKKLVLEDKLRYPSIKFFVQTSLLEKALREKENVDGKLMEKESVDGKVKNKEEK